MDSCKDLMGVGCVAVINHARSVRNDLIASFLRSVDLSACMAYRSTDEWPTCKHVK